MQSFYGFNLEITGSRSTTPRGRVFLDIEFQTIKPRPSSPTRTQELEEAFEEGRKSGRLVVVFGGLTWCRPCKAMQRPVQKMAEHYKVGGGR